MLSATSFKDKLRNFPRPKSSAIRQHLDRWLDDPIAEGVWRKISKLAHNLEAEELIRQVIRARSRAAGFKPTLNQYAGIREWTLHSHRQQIKAALASKLPLHEIAKVLEIAAAEFLTIDEFYSSRLEGAVRRKDQNSSLMRHAFYLQVGSFLHQQCGRWMDAEVATLADIAFHGTENTIVQIRAARLPTTSSGRSLKGNQARH
jgi:hypothetical protein